METQTVSPTHSEAPNFRKQALHHDLNTLMNPKLVDAYARLEEVKQAAKDMEHHQGINPLDTYCSRTGRKTGTLYDSILHSSLTSIQSDDMEEILDELLTRCALSMRPAPDLIYLSGDSLKALIDHNPTAALIFFLSKAFESKNRDFMAVCPTHKSSRHKHKFDSSESAVTAKVKWNLGLVELYQNTNKSIPLKNIKKFCWLLMSIDSQLGLHKLNPPSDFWGFDLLTKARPFSDCMKLIRHYRNELDKIEKSNNFFYDNANSLTQAAMTIERNITGRKKTPKQREKQRKLNNLTSRLSTILASPESLDSLINTTPKPTEPAKIQKSTGFKLALPKGLVK